MFPLEQNLTFVAVETRVALFAFALERSFAVAINASWQAHALKNKDLWRIKNILF